MDIVHDFLKSTIYFFFGPLLTDPVLRHFKSGHRYSTSVCSLSGSEEHRCFENPFNGFFRARHVSALSNTEATVSDELLHVRFVKFVLSSARQRHIARELPRLLTRMEGRCGVPFRIFL